MSQTKCSYHPDKIAIDKCERCQRPICLEGKRVYHKKHRRGTGASRRTWSTRHVYCPPCQADVATNEASGVGAIFGSIFFIIIGIIVTAGFASVAGPLALFPLIIVGLGIMQMRNRAIKADNARKDEEQFLNSLNQSPKGVNRKHSYNRMKSYTRPDKAWSLSDVHCFECGEKLDVKAKFCMNCGDSTVDEKEFIEKQNN